MQGKYPDTPENFSSSLLRRPAAPPEVTIWWPCVCAINNVYLGGFLESLSAVVVAIPLSPCQRCL